MSEDNLQLVLQGLSDAHRGDKSIVLTYDSALQRDDAWLLLGDFGYLKDRAEPIEDQWEDWFLPGYATEMDYMNANEADDYRNEGYDE